MQLLTVVTILTLIIIKCSYGSPAYIIPSPPILASNLNNHEEDLLAVPSDKRFNTVLRNVPHPPPPPHLVNYITTASHPPPSPPPNAVNYLSSSQFTHNEPQHVNYITEVKSPQLNIIKKEKQQPFRVVKQNHKKPVRQVMYQSQRYNPHPVSVTHSPPLSVTHSQHYEPVSHSQHLGPVSPTTASITHSQHLGPVSPTTASISHSHHHGPVTHSQHLGPVSPTPESIPQARYRVPVNPTRTVSAVRQNNYEYQHYPDNNGVQEFNNELQLDDQNNDDYYDDGRNKYHFVYRVQDDDYKPPSHGNEMLGSAIPNDYGHTEATDGKTTVGKYYVKLPDGRVQTVQYRADHTGYHAKVVFVGEAQHPKRYNLNSNGYSNSEIQNNIGSQIFDLHSKSTSNQLRFPDNNPPMHIPDQLRLNSDQMQHKQIKSSTYKKHIITAENTMNTETKLPAPEAISSPYGVFTEDDEEEEEEGTVKKDME